MAFDLIRERLAREAMDVEDDGDRLRFYDRAGEGDYRVSGEVHPSGGGKYDVFLSLEQEIHFDDEQRAREAVQTIERATAGSTCRVSGPTLSPHEQGQFVVEVECESRSRKAFPRQVTDVIDDLVVNTWHETLGKWTRRHGTRRSRLGDVGQFSL